MCLPRLYEQVTLRSYSEMRYFEGRPEGYGSGSPFAMGLNTLVTRTFTDYIHSFKVIGEWKEHDMDDYTKGRVPDNTMMLQVAMRAALDKMKNLKAFAWELNTKPMNTVWQSIMTKPSITSLTLRFQTKRIPRPTTIIPPLPNLITLVVYDIDPLCYPDDISLLILQAKKLENLKMHWNPRMRESGEESVNLLNYFGRCFAARHLVPAKRVALYNLYARNSGEGFDECSDPATAEEVTLINCMGSSDPLTVFLDDTWRLKDRTKHPPPNLKMMRGDFANKDFAMMLADFRGLERLYLVNNKRKPLPTSTTTSKSTDPSAVPSPTTPSTHTPSGSGNTPFDTTPLSELQCRGLAGDYLAAIQSNHRTMRHLLLSDHWQLSAETIFKLCQSCPDLEQLAFSSNVPPLDSLHEILKLVPKLWAIRILIRHTSELAETMNSMDAEMHEFALSMELWKPAYRNLRYLSMGDGFIYRLGEVRFPAGIGAGAGGRDGVGGRGGGGRGRDARDAARTEREREKLMQAFMHEKSMSARRFGPMRVMKRVTLEEVRWIEIWGMDSSEFDSKFP